MMPWSGKCEIKGYIDIAEKKGKGTWCEGKGNKKITITMTAENETQITHDERGFCSLRALWDVNAYF